MKKNITLVALVAVILLLSCSDEDKGIDISAIKITSSLSLKVEETRALEVQILPENTTEKAEFSWASSDESIAGVDEKGTITALKNGEVTITVMLTKNPAIKSECVVTVSKKDLDPNAIVEFEDRKLAALMLTHDTNNDGKLQVSEVLEIETLVVTANGITSLKGIEYLTNLEVLDCSYNDITEADLSANKKLKEFYIKNNKVGKINVAGLSLLEVFDCSANRLSEIDVTSNTELKKLRIAMNHEGRGDNGAGITKIDVSKNTKLELLDLNYTNVSELDLSQNPKLKWIDFSLTSYTSPSTNPITKIDFSNNKELEHISCDAMIRTYDMNGNLIEDKKGLSTIDVSMLPKLQHLSFSGNSIKNLDVSKNLELTYLNCGRNFLSSLDVTKNTKLKTLINEWNTISVLDLTKNTSLEYLNCANNKIGKLDISKTRMGYLLGNDNLIAEFNVGDKVFDTPGGRDKKPYLYMKLNNNKIASIDLSKQVNLAWLEINDNELTSLDISNCTGLGGVLLNNNKVANLNISKITRIWEVQAKNNKLSGDLDLSHLVNLSRLCLEGNPNLKNVKVWSGFKENCSNLIIDHTLGSKESKLCYSKDDGTSWVR